MIPEPPQTEPLEQILPLRPHLLMGAGPVPIHPHVAAANSLVINHLGPVMSQVIAQLRLAAQYVFQTESEKIIGVAGPASAVMEMAITNTVWPGRSVLVLNIGTFSKRWADMSRRVGGSVKELKGDGIAPIGLVEVQAAMTKQHFDVVIITHGETSSGVLTTELGDICAYINEQDGLSIVDAVTTLGAIDFRTDAWQVDMAVAGGQKALGSIPGVSLIAFSARAWQVIEERKEPLPHWCLDAKLAWEFWGEGKYHYTAPVPGVLAMYQALRMINNEGLESRFLRHHRASKYVQDAVEAIGLELFAEKAYRLPTVISIKVPESIDGNKLRAVMRENFAVEIAGAFGHNIVRIGQMGEQTKPDNIERTLEALEKSLKLLK